jgi:DNA-binding MarR family transcriptional regulator
MNQEQLAAVVHVQSQTLGRVLTRLEAEGLVTRTRDSHDRRQFLVEITGAGEAALRAAREAEIAALPSDFDGWGILREQLTRLLSSIPAPSKHRIPPATDPGK